MVAGVNLGCQRIRKHSWPKPWRGVPIRRPTVTSAAATEARQLRRLIDLLNKAGDFLANSAYRSHSSENWLARNMMTSRIHRRRRAGKPIAERSARANAKTSSVRAAVEHVFAHPKNRYGLFTRKIGLARAQAEPMLANLAHNFNRLIFHEQRSAAG